MNNSIDQSAPYEKTSLTFELVSITARWYQEASQENAGTATQMLGCFISRTINFLITPITNAIDAAAKIIFGAFEVIFSLGDGCRSAPYFPSINFSGALATLESGFKHIPSIIFTSLIGTIDPNKALNTFKGYQPDHTAELQKVNCQLQGENEALRRALLKVTAENNSLKKCFSLSTSETETETSEELFA